MIFYGNCIEVDKKQKHNGPGCTCVRLRAIQSPSTCPSRQASLAIAAASASGGGGALVGKRRQWEVGGSPHRLLARGVEAVG
jgi:hypothetical protein